MLVRGNLGMRRVFATVVVGSTCGLAVQDDRIDLPPRSDPRRFVARSGLVPLWSPGA